MNLAWGCELPTKDGQTFSGPNSVTRQNEVVTSKSVYDYYGKLNPRQTPTVHQAGEQVYLVILASNQIRKFGKRANNDLSYCLRIYDFD